MRRVLVVAGRAAALAVAGAVTGAAVAVVWDGIVLLATLAQTPQYALTATTWLLLTAVLATPACAGAGLIAGVVGSVAAALLPGVRARGRWGLALVGALVALPLVWVLLGEFEESSFGTWNELAAQAAVVITVAVLLVQRGSVALCARIRRRVETRPSGSSGVLRTV